MGRPAIEFEREYLTPVRSLHLPGSYLQNLIYRYGDELNHGIVGQTIRKNVPELAANPLFYLAPVFERSGMAPMNFVLLSFKKGKGWNHPSDPPQIFLNVFIGLVKHYPEDFVDDAQKSGVKIDMEELFDLRYRESDKTAGSEKTIRDQIYRDFFSRERKYDFYHVLVFKLNLRSFGEEEYAMLSYLWGAVESFYSSRWNLPRPYSIGVFETEQAIHGAIQRVEHCVDEERNLAFTMSQHSRLGQGSVARALGPDVTRMIAAYSLPHATSTESSVLRGPPEAPIPGWQRDPQPGASIGRPGNHAASF
eukprot:3519049-Rhodomonas_salina.1